MNAYTLINASPEIICQTGKTDEHPELGQGIAGNKYKYEISFKSKTCKELENLKNKQKFYLNCIIKVDFILKILT